MLEDAFGLLVVKVVHDLKKWVSISVTEKRKEDRGAILRARPSRPDQVSIRCVARKVQCRLDKPGNLKSCILGFRQAYRELKDDVATQNLEYLVQLS